MGVARRSRALVSPFRIGLGFYSLRWFRVLTTENLLALDEAGRDLYFSGVSLSPETVRLDPISRRDTALFAEGPGEG